MIIREQSLSGDYFVVLNQRSGQCGRVPVDYIEISQFTYTATTTMYNVVHTCMHTLPGC